MQFKKICFSLVMAFVLITAMSSVNAASPKKGSYTEDEFLTAFSGKTKKVVNEKLGEPVKKEMSVKPTGASGMMQKAGADEKNSKPVKVEMWYYKNLVKYDPKRTYKETEITFVNDVAMNIAFFNNR
ncbi:MAG: hypothetical protein H0W85_02430 [Methylotenera sp.]|nr:hypothetical protein [Methylotenera sp.]